MSWHWPSQDARAGVIQHCLQKPPGFVLISSMHALGFVFIADRIYYILSSCLRDYRVFHDMRYCCEFIG